VNRLRDEPSNAECEAWWEKLKREVTAEVIASLPAAKSGLNDSLPGAAHALKWFYTGDELIDLLDTVLREKRGAKYRPGEAQRQVNFALGGNGKGTGESRKVEPDWPDFEPDLWKKLDIPECSVYDLWERSPVRFEDGIHTREVLRSLFPTGPWLCFGRKKTQSRGDIGDGYHHKVAH
jgi:hypothetical protein